MSMDNFLSFLQQLITMTDYTDKQAMALAKIALNAVVTLANESKKVDYMTRRMMITAEAKFEYLMLNRQQFAGFPGDLNENLAKRRRLADLLMPGC